MNRLCNVYHYFSDTDDCATVTCQNGGTCVDGVNSFTCSCDTGYEGNNCETSKLYLSLKSLFLWLIKLYEEKHCAHTLEI